MQRAPLDCRFACGDSEAVRFSLPRMRWRIRKDGERIWQPAKWPRSGRRWSGRSFVKIMRNRHPRRAFMSTAGGTRIRIRDVAARDTGLSRASPSGTAV